MIGFYFLCWIATRNALSQTVTWTTGTAVPRFFEDLKLVCSVSSDCCDSFSRIWEKGTGTQILNDGSTTFTNKYAEEWDRSTSGFNLTIKNLQLTDVGVDYKCQYKLGEENKQLVLDSTWEYPPRESCPITTISSENFGMAKHTVNIARAAPYPSVFAYFGDKNITSDLVVTGVTNYDTWFYSLTVSLDNVDCFGRDIEKGYTLSIVTGTKVTNICNKVNLCYCWFCGIRVFAYECIGSAINLIATAAGFFKQCKHCLSSKEWKRIAAALAFPVISSFTLNGIIATVGIYFCLCLEGTEPLMIFCGIGTGLVGTIIAAIFYKKLHTVRYISLLFLLGGVAGTVSVIDLSLIAELMNGHCLNCGGSSFLWSFIGSVVALVSNYSFLLYSRFKLDKKRCAIFSVSIWMMSLVVGVVLAVPIGVYLCPCFDWHHPFFIFLGLTVSYILCAAFWFTSLFDKDECYLKKCLDFAGLVVLSLLIFPIPFMIIYVFYLKDDENCSCKQFLYFAGLVVLSFLIFPIPFMIIYIFLEGFVDYIVETIGSDVKFTSPYKDDSGQIIWIKLNHESKQTYSEGTNINVQDLPQELVDRLTVKGRDLLISNIQESDAGIYACELSSKADARQVAKLNLTVRGGGNNRSKESGSSCWPPCSVGPDPNSPESENARSLLKKNADKKNEKKPVAVVRSQPPKNRHVKTDNTESTRYSAETEIFDEGVHKSAKPRPLPSIGQPTNSPRPLPQMPPSSQLEKGGIQLEPLGDSTSEKKKKKRRKKKESKQSGDED